MSISIFVLFFFFFVCSESVEDILENRIAELEKKIFGLEGKPKDGSSASESSIVEQVEHVNTLISSALSGREKLNTLIQRLPELEEYSKTDFEPVDQDIAMKLEYILTMEPEIRENVRRLNKLKELMPVLDSDRFNSVPEMSEKLASSSLRFIDLGNQASQVDEATKTMINRYNDIITNVSKTLIAMDADITLLEKEAEPKKVME